jgi:hypothetical protein
MGPNPTFGGYMALHGESNVRSAVEKQTFSNGKQEDERGN